MKKRKFFKNLFESFSLKVYKFMEWFFTDAAYGLLPIIVIAIIKYLTYHNLSSLRLSPEWSFATIVFFGTSITNFIKLKTRVQQDSTARIFTGTRLYMFLLIASVIVLSLVILQEQGTLINTNILGIFQKSLLVVSMLSLLMSYLYEQEEFEFESKLKKGVRRGTYYKLLYKKIDRIHNELLYLNLALTKHKESKYSDNISSVEEEFWEKMNRKKLAEKMNDISKDMALVKNLSKKLCEIPITEE